MLSKIIMEKNSFTIRTKIKRVIRRNVSIDIKSLEIIKRFHQLLFFTLKYQFSHL